VIHCYLSKQRFHFCFETFQSRLLSRWAAVICVRAARPSGCARCGAGAGRSVIKHQSLILPGIQIKCWGVTRMQQKLLHKSTHESCPTRGQKGACSKCGVIRFVPDSSRALGYPRTRDESPGRDGHEGRSTLHHDFILLHVSSGKQSCVFP